MTNRKLLAIGISLVLGMGVAVADDDNDNDDDDRDNRRYRPHDQRPVSEFAEARLYVEVNQTDGDTEIVLLAKGGDDGLRRFSVKSPGNRQVFSVRSNDRSVMGLREFAIESPEPAGDQILAAYPEGTYTFSGATHNGERFRSTATLEHELPFATTILSPIEDSTVPVGPLSIVWSPVPGILEYRLELVNESADPEQTTLLNLPADATSFEVPTGLIKAGSDYQVSVATIAENGNTVGVEIVFSTEE